jgi:hypothetical protein
MESLQDLPLNIAVKIDEQVAACHEVKLRKWRVTQDIVHGEEDLFPERFADNVKPPGVCEKLPQP